MEITSVKSVAKKVKKELGKYQKGKKKTIKTGRPWLDDLFPVINGSVITIAAPSGVGKSTELQKLMKNIMNEDVNPAASNYVHLNISLEMKLFSLMLRDLSDSLDKKKVDVLLKEFSEKEKELARDCFEAFEDKRNFISQVPTSPKQFRESVSEFLEDNKDKESVFVSIDHIALFGSDGGGKNETIEELIEAINDLKMKYSNAVFILLSQMNGDIAKRAADKNFMSQPKDNDLYYSKFTFQVSDYVVVIINPYKLGIVEYSKVNSERYQNLKSYFIGFDSKQRGYLKSGGVLYFHLLKCREAEGNFIDIYAEDMVFRDPASYNHVSLEPTESEESISFDYLSEKSGSIEAAEKALNFGGGKKDFEDDEF